MSQLVSNRTQAWSTAVAASTVLPPRLTTSWLVRKLLLAAFLAAFLQYWTHTMITQYVHVALLLLAGLAVLAGTQRGSRLHHLLGGGALLFTAVLFTEVVSYYSGDRYSLLYGAALIAVILSARLIVQQIGMTEVLRAYYRAGVFITIFLAAVGRRGISRYSAGERFSGNGDAHPNLVAFVLAGFLPVMIWRTVEYRSPLRRRISAALCALNFLLVFLSGSRGALLAVFVALVACVLRVLFAGRLKGRVHIQHIHVILVLAVLPLLLVFFAQHGRVQKLQDFFVTALSLNNSQRGLKSGFSGRTAFWTRALHRLGEEDRWFFGFGYRMGDVMVGTIDDGYLQLLFETGLISGLMILGVLVTAFIRLWRMTQVRENSPWLRYHFTLWCMLIIYFINNISTRYLFSFGNSFSICIIFLMVCSRRELLGRQEQMPARKPERQRSGPPKPILQARGYLR